MKGLYDQFFDKRGELLETIRSFEERRDLRLLSSLKKEMHEGQFLSKITEIQFGLFFDPYASSMAYEKTIHNQTPDWTIEVNGQTIVIEVFRLNPSANDKLELDFEDAFMDALQQIPVGCFLYFDYDQQAIDRDGIDLEKCKQVVTDWLAISRVNGETLQLFNTIEVEFGRYEESVTHVCLAGGGGSIHFDYRRLNATNSQLVRKGMKYSALLQQYPFPYLIAMYMDFHTWFRKDDVFRSLYGSSVHHLESAEYYSHSLADALYYRSLAASTSPLQGVSGVLLRQADDYTYFRNFTNHRLNQQNNHLLDQWQHPYE